MVQVSKAKLLHALECVKPGLSSKEVVEQSGHFVFLEDRIVTYNDEISISHPLPGLSVRGAVKSSALYDFLNKVTTDDIVLEMTETEIIVKAGRATAGLVLEKEVTLPLEETVQKGTWHDLCSDFLTGLRWCAPCCAMDYSRPILTCIHVNKDILEASDGYQIIRYKLDHPVKTKQFLLPHVAARELIRYTPTSTSEGTGWMHFRTGEGTIFSSRILPESYPNTDAPLKVEGTPFTFPDSMQAALKRAAVFSKRGLGDIDPATVTVEIENNRVKLRANNEHGWFKEEMKLSYKGTPIGFSVDVNLLIELFSRIRTCIIGKERIRFEGDNWEHVVAVTCSNTEKGK